MLLDGKIALITGASRGIGKTVAETFISHGASILITGRSDSLHHVAEELTQRGGNVAAIQGDINDEQHVREVMKVCLQQHGRLDILVNNAGILLQGLLGMIKIDLARNMFETNVLAMLNLTQYSVRLMGRSHSPSIINIASIAGTQGIEGISAYSASKGAVIGFTLSAAKELAEKSIRVNAIAPGFIDTEMTHNLPKEWYQKRIDGIRLGRIGTPQDIANCALFLASDLASYITGTIIGVDGGMTI